MQRHTHQEFIRFLNAVEHAAPADKPVHAILDNYATHKHRPRTTPSRVLKAANKVVVPWRL